MERGAQADEPVVHAQAAPEQREDGGLVVARLLAHLEPFDEVAWSVLGAERDVRAAGAQAGGDVVA